MPRIRSEAFARGAMREDGLRVCLITPYFAPRVGGVETYTADLAEWLSQRGCDVAVATWTPSCEVDEYPYAIYRCPSLAGLAGVMRWCDVVQFNAPNPIHCALAKSLRKPTVWAHFDYPTLCPKGIAWWDGQECSFGWRRCLVHLGQERPKPAVARAIAAYWLRRACAHVVDCNVLASRHGLMRIAPPKGRVIPLGVRLPSSVLMNSPGEPSRRFVFWGRHIVEKGGDVVIRAVEHLKRADVTAYATLCGTGPESGRWKDLARTLGVDDQVELRGFVAYEALEELLMSSVAVLVPSLNDEYFGLVALEAMSRGIVVIASDTGGLGEIVRDAGLVFERDNPAALAEKMAALLQNPQLRAELATRARKTAVEHYSASAMGARYLALYQQLAADRRRRD